KDLYQGFAIQLHDFVQQTKITPRLDVILIGDNPASQLYVQNKQRMCSIYGIQSHVHHLPATAAETQVFALIDELNSTPYIHGILLQLPLPPHLDSFSLLSRIHPLKDVDGLHPENLGALMHNRPRLIPCTPLGCLQLIHSYRADITGAKALVVGRSVLVGKPMALLLTHHNATVTSAHSQSRDLAELCRQAEILVVAVGVAHLIKGDWLTKNAIVIDVGMNRDATGGLCGDVESSHANVAAITTVPGGVGPLTIANLLNNTLKAAQYQQC
ncbi:MAG: bifunctional 5,10-methylenetetrahydrofolate dehydrogenase/5,10-methenyltetrahydrofolate cyclohydrolase, partial [Alphaproteobacteria bacterium]